MPCLLAFELDRESAELDQATKAVGFEPDAQTALVPQPAVERRGPPPTIKEAVLHVLAEAPSGMTSKAILDEINIRFFLVGSSAPASAHS